MRYAIDVPNYGDYFDPRDFATLGDTRFAP